jgi:acyl-CoA dehydrogenase
MEAAPEPQTSAAPQPGEATFSLELTQDQKDVRDWVHGFAEQTVRPAASEWDEREETPWPVIQEAARIGLYSFEGIAQFWLDQTGIMFPIVTEQEQRVAAFCVSEPDAGSDVSSLRTRARYDEAKDEWVLNGQKAWATNGGIGDVHVIVAQVDAELKARGHASFVIGPGTRGLEMGTKVKKHGLRASHTADVFLDDVRVPGSCLLAARTDSTRA